ncbi:MULTISPECIES: hypothetical protein [Photorhabdus]|uniref:hypothetical protein n=1 Tax=Photorhabdus TaxID=29487 RepID=UPI000DCB60F7|nr:MULTISPECIES: hypothetical protein [Photorhabdus]MCT8342384.1 hypothetical protein [Photorhabdus kleinii]RAW92214.1 hypothetical protein CKY05_23335 [Photorhabdus sp. S10-54]RAW92467.1 hypothetical protein CKY03_23170 [Photorhabdus sp. S9-53]RAW95924.1 hypothetical protein CKY04_23275 [Photorhabdus sp. S8-52]
MPIKLWAKPIVLILVLIGMFALAHWRGHATGFQKAMEIGNAALAQQKAAFLLLEKQRVERELAALNALQKRYQMQVNTAHQAEANYLNDIERLRTQNQQLKRKIDHVTQRWMDEKQQFHPVNCVFTRGFMQQYNAAFGLSSEQTCSASVTSGADETSCGNESSDAQLRPSGITQRDILANIIDNGEQCLALKAQVNGLLDYIEGLQQ